MDDELWPQARRVALIRDRYQCHRCGAADRSELDVHHRMPRSIQVDHSPANLVTLCDGCHAGIHLNLQVGLARRTIQRWAVRVARLLDFQNEIPDGDLNFDPWLQLLGKSRFRDGQLPVILAITAGQNVLAVRPTGSGKSLCFQIPILMRPGCGLVIEPLKALMKDQVQGLHVLKLPATFISSDVPPDERRQRYELLEDGSWKFLYLAPERFDAELIRERSEIERLTRFRPNIMVVDEAHTVSQFGDGFRPIYAQLAGIRESVGTPQILAFTATASPNMQRRICESLGVPDATVIVEDPDRPNITLARLPLLKSDFRRIDVIAELLRGLHVGRAIIFVPTVKEGRQVQAALLERGVDLEFFHSKAHDPAWRDNVQGRFAGRILPVINSVIATSAFGMGLDIPDIRLVVHWQQPFSIEEYAQGFGRAGRDGQRSLAVLFTDEQQDRYLLDFMARTTEARDVQARLADIDTMARLANGRGTCFRKGLIDHLVGIRPHKPTVSMRILNWAFSERKRASRAKECCDYCDEGLTGKILSGLYRL